MLTSKQLYVSCDFEGDEMAQSARSGIKYTQKKPRRSGAFHKVPLYHSRMNKEFQLSRLIRSLYREIWQVLRLLGPTNARALFRDDIPIEAYETNFADNPNLIDQNRVEC